MSTNIRLVIPFREQLKDPLGLEFDNLTTAVNFNLGSPTSPVRIALFYADFLPDPFKAELEQLAASLNTGFTNIAAGSHASPLILEHREELNPQAVTDQFEYFIATTNQGLSELP